MIIDDLLIIERLLKIVTVKSRNDEGDGKIHFFSEYLSILSLYMIIE